MVSGVLEKICNYLIYMIIKGEFEWNIQDIFELKRLKDKKVHLIPNNTYACLIPG